MTNAEKLARQERNAKARVARMNKALAQVTVRRKKLEQRTRERRYLLVGALVDQAGLFTFTDSTLAELFAQLGRLADIPNPVSVLEALLHDISRANGATDTTLVCLDSGGMWGTPETGCEPGDEHVDGASMPARASETDAADDARNAGRNSETDEANGARTARVEQDSTASGAATAAP